MSSEVRDREPGPLAAASARWSSTRTLLLTLLAAAVLFLAAHLAYLPPSLEDIDSINFALGVQHFDVAQHRPHPPGYPVFIALSKVSTRVLRSAGVAAPEVRGLAVWSAVGGALVVVFAGAFLGAVARDRRLGLLAALLTACAPLFWFTALRPLSDTIGLAAVFAALAALTGAIDTPGLKHGYIRGTPDLEVGPTKVGSPAGATPLDLKVGHATRTRALLVGALLAGVTIGVRSQTFVMTLPLLAYVLVGRRNALSVRTRVLACVATVAGVAVWAVPLVIASGGPAAYLKALGGQGAEDFSGVVMLWTHRTPRVAAYALLNEFVLPWDSFVLAAVVLLAAAFGSVITLWRTPRTAIVLALVFLPYAAFQLLFNEVGTVRYALPLVPAVAFLAVAGLAAIHEFAAVVTTIVLAVAGLALSMPACIGFARQPSPVFRMLADMGAQAQRNAPPLIAMHRRELTETRRPREWVGGLPGSLLAAPRDYEWLEVTRAWRDGAPAPVWFIADPRRTDLTLIDEHGSRTSRYRWPFRSSVYVGGARPDEMDWHVFTSPAWFLEQGWALTPEVAGITERDGWGPHRRPSVGWIRRDVGNGVMLVGGRHLGGPAEPPMRVTMDVDGHPLLTQEIKPGFFFTTVQVPSSALDGEGRFARLTARAEPVTPGGPLAAVSLEQFDLQPRGVAMFGFDEGWFEPEYNPITSRFWRWMSPRAVLRVLNTTESVTFHIAGENPRRYYKSAPVLRVSAGPRELATYRPDRDFSYTFSVPADALAASGGRVTLESDLMFIPAERGGTGDLRHLAIRIYSVTIDR